MIKQLILFTIFQLFFLNTSTLAQTQNKQEVLERITRLSNNKLYNEALVQLESLMIEYPDDKNLLLEKAQLIDKRGDRVECLKILYDAKNRFPNSDTVIAELAYMLRFSGQLDSALFYNNLGLKLARNSSDSLIFHINIGGLYIDKQEYAKAINYYEHLNKQYPESIEILNNLSQAYSYNHQNDKALKIMLLLVDNHPSFETMSNIGLLYTEMENYEEAYKYLKMCVNDHPEEAFLLNNFGYLLYKMKDYNNSLIQINKSMTINTTNPYAYRNRALVFIALNMLNEACKDLHASSELGFKIYYGNEVEELQSKYCKK